MDRPDIVVVGSVNMDVTARVARLPRPGETVAGDDHRCWPGGKGANQAVAAGRLGAGVALVGRVGGDPFGAELASRLAAEGIDVTHVEALPDVPTGVALIVVDADGENMITFCPGANHRLTPASLDGLPDLLRTAEVLLLQLEIAPATALAAARAARAAGVRVVLNVAPLSASIGDDVRELVRVADVVVANETEAARLTGLDPHDAGLATDALRALGPDAVVITLGARGAVAADASGVTTVPAFPVTAVDTVGAGDAFCAELAIALRDGAELAAAAARACAAGALTATREGAQASLPTRAEVDELLAGRAGEELLRAP